MPGRAPKHCGKPGCTITVKGRVYCPTHEAQHQALLAARRPTTAARGYGAKHQADREQWAPLVAHGNVPCRRCGEPITKGQAWDMGHDDNDRTLPALPEHASRCNRTKAGSMSPLVVGTSTRGRQDPPIPPPN